jgi:hypothetical protein
MLRTRTIFLLMLITALLVSVAGISAQDATPEATPEVVGTAPGAAGGVKAVLADGDVIEGTFEGEVTAHLYGFNASAGDVVTISMTQPEESVLDPYLVLMDANGAVIAADDDSGEDPVYSSLISNVLLEDGGSYFVLATSFVYIDNILAEMTEGQDDIEAGQIYELTINGITAPEGGDPEVVTINAETLTPGSTAEGESTAAAPVAFYTFAGAEGDVRTITLESEDFDGILHVFAPNGDRVAINNNDPGLGDTNAAVRDLTLAEAGTYLIWATDKFFYDYTIMTAETTYEGGAFTLGLE